MIAVETQRRVRPSLQDVGLNRLGIFLLFLNASVLLADVAMYAGLGMTIAGSTLALNLGLILVLIGIWANFYLIPGGPKEWFVAELVLVVALMLFLTNTASLFQYGAIALGFQFADWWLAAADAAMGINVESLAAWTLAHPFAKDALEVAYFSFLPQMFFVIIVMAAKRDRLKLWEFAFVFHVCLIVSVGALIPFPAVCPPEYLQFTPSIDMTHLIGQIKALHAGTLLVVRTDELEGLVSFPSFHVAGALAATWSMRGRPWFFWPLLVLNVTLVAATFVTGVHYVTDVLASFPIFLVSVIAYRRVCSSWLSRKTAAPASLM